MCRYNVVSVQLCKNWIGTVACIGRAACFVTPVCDVRYSGVYR